MKRIPIITQFGELYGRDKLYLDEFIVGNKTQRIKLIGAITTYDNNDNIIWENYIISFEDVMAFKCIEMDSGDYKWNSSFEEIIESEWIRELGGKINNEYHHYFLQTYDDIIDVIAKVMSIHYTGKRAQQVDSAEASTIAVPPSDPSGSPR